MKGRKRMFSSVHTHIRHIRAYRHTVIQYIHTSLVMGSSPFHSIWIPKHRFGRSPLSEAKPHRLRWSIARGLYTCIVMPRLWNRFRRLHKRVWKRKDCLLGCRFIPLITTSSETQPQMIPTVNLQPWYFVKRHDVIIPSICKILPFDVSSVSGGDLPSEVPLFLISGTVPVNV